MNEDLITIEIDELFDIEELNGSKRFLEFLIKKSGIWEFHKYDKDPFPSIPHGHNKEKKQKLNVYNGIIYDITTKKPIKKIRQSKMEEIRMELTKAGFKLNF